MISNIKFVKLLIVIQLYKFNYFEKQNSYVIIIYKVDVHSMLKIFIN